MELVESVTYAVCGDENVDFEKFRTIFGDKNVSLFLAVYREIKTKSFFRAVCSTAAAVS